MEDFKKRLCSPWIFRRVYEAFLDKPLAEGVILEGFGLPRFGHNHLSTPAIEELYQKVLATQTLEECKPAILEAIQHCKMGLHFCGDESEWMIDKVGYKGEMVDLGQMIHSFLHPLRKQV
jgi:hypothetical protein